MKDEIIAHNCIFVSYLRKGYTGMITACIVYLLWWFVNYFPDSPFSDFHHKPAGIAIWISMFAAVLLICIAAVKSISTAFRSMKTDRNLINMKMVLLLSIVSSIMLPVLISFSRFITLDIFLIIWWAFMELGVADLLYGSHLMERRTGRNAVVRTIIYTIESIILYIIYPLPPAYIRFILGGVPILLYAFEMSWMAERMRKAENKQYNIKGG